MNKEELGNKFKSFLSKTAESSKNAFVKAGDKVQEFSDKSVLKIEKKQLESKRDAKYLVLGEKLSQFMLENKIDLPEGIAAETEALQQEITALSAQIKAKDEAIGE